MRWTGFLGAAGGYPLALAAVGVTSLVLLPLRGLLNPGQIVLLYVPAIVAVARSAGVRPSAAAALAALLAADLLFVPPYYVFVISSPANWITLAVFLLVALIAGLQTGGMRLREQAAMERQKELALLHRLSSRLVSEDSLDRMAADIVAEVVAVFALDRAALYALDPSGVIRRLAQAGGPSTGLGEAALAQWVSVNDKAVGLPPAADAASGPWPATVAGDAAVDKVVADGVYVPLQTNAGLEGVLYSRQKQGTPWDLDGARRLLAVANVAAAFLERRRLGDEASRVAAAHESDRLKATIVSSVSHELKTPLAAVTARVTGLLEEGEGCDAARVQEELTYVSEDLNRLDASIRDLLDVSRLESDSWRPRLEDYEISEILGSAAAHLTAAQRSRVIFEIGEDLPSVHVDFAQWARALSNIIENALAYSPPQEPVTVGARVLGGDVIVWVEDRGAGVPDADKERIFEKFQRGSTAADSAFGTGLGLAIAREIARSHGGRVWVEDAEPTGARFVLSWPLAENKAAR